MPEFEIRDARPQDVAMLTRFWNESRAAWPGQFGGVAITEHRVREQLRSTNFLKFFVVASRQRIIGQCYLWPSLRERQVAFVANLVVHQDFQGRKFGKRLLLAAVNAAVKMRHKRIDLNTWPGNLQAMPLYKKAGFYWVPDTRVHMQNFLPTIFSSPIAKRYFANHDWYETFKRELKQEEDKTRVRGRQVFSYQWAAGGDRLSVLIDRESGSICEISDGDIHLSVSAEQQPIVGLPNRIRWLIRKRSRDVVPVKITSRGEAGVELGFQETFSLDRSRQIGVPLKINREVKPKDDGTAHRIETRLRIGRDVNELGVGMRPKQPVEVSTEPGAITVAQGQTAAVTIELRSNLNRRASGRLRFRSTQGLTVECGDNSFDLPARGAAGVPLKVRPHAKGVSVIECRPELKLAGRLLKSRVEKIYLSCSEPGQVTCFRREDAAVIDNDVLRLTSLALGARVILSGKLDFGALGSLESPELGPPFMPGEFGWRKFDQRLFPAPNAATAELSAASDKFPGITLTRRLTMSAGPSIAVVHHAHNRGSHVYELELRLTVFPGARDAQFTMPTAEGLVRAPFASDIRSGNWPEKPEDLEESWIAWDARGMVLGLIWEKSTRFSIFPTQLDISLGRLEPGGKASHPPVYLYAGPGDWRAVRSVWERYVQKPPSITKKPEPKSVPIQTVTVEPTPTLVQGEAGKARITVRVLSKLTHEGKLELLPPPGWQANPRSFEFKGVNVDRPWARDVRFSLTRKPVADVGRLVVRLSTRAEDQDLVVPLICTGEAGQSVRVRRKETAGLEVFVVSNGRLTLRISPQFMAGLFALEEGAVNHLFSAFPKPRPFWVENNWYGGLHPFLLGPAFPTGVLDKEKFACRAAAEKGRQGLRWSGVRLASRINRPGCNGVSLAVQYLTLPQSNIVAVRTTIRNRSTAHFRCSGLVHCYLQVGGDRRDAVLYYEQERLRYRRRFNIPLFFDTQDWAAVGNSKGNKFVAMINASDDSWIHIEDLYQEGAHLRQQADVRVRPGSARTFLCYLVVTDSADKAHTYASLSRARTL